VSQTIRTSKEALRVNESEHALLASISSVAQRALADDSSLVESLQAVAAAGCSLIEPCTRASITIIERGRPATVACTDDVALALDQAQYEVGDGPCLAAARDTTVIRLDHTEAAARWPSFAASAQAHGVQSSLSVPLMLSGDGVHGGLNLYGSAAEAFGEDDQHVAEVFASQASVVVANAISYWQAFEQSRQLTAAMESRAVIEQAKGVLMGAQHCSADEAFDLLRRASQRENRKLRDIAVEVVERAIRPEAT
jgi:GAF domain-containing protein